MPDTPMAVAGWVLPVPGPPTNTALCASSVKAVLARVATSLRSTGETSKSKPARSRCTGNFAVCIWWLTERIARSVVSACSRCSMSQCEDSTPLLPPCSIRSTQAPAMPCWRSDFNSTSTSGFMAGLLGGVVTVAGHITAQSVVARGVGQRRCGHLQLRGCRRRRRLRVQPPQHVNDRLHANPAPAPSPAPVPPPPAPHRARRTARWPAPAPSPGRRPACAAGPAAATAVARACRRTARRSSAHRASSAAAGCSAASHSGSPRRCSAGRGAPRSCRRPR